MTTQTEALKLALKALEDIRDDCSGCEFEWNNDYPLQAKAHAAIKEALAQPDENRSALSLYESGFIDGKEKGLKEAQRTWVGLTDAERLEIAKQNMLSGLDAFAKAIEAKLKEKNT